MRKTARAVPLLICLLAGTVLYSCDRIDRYALDGTFTFSKNGSPETIDLSNYTRSRVRISRNNSFHTYLKGKKHESSGDILWINFFCSAGNNNETVAVNLSRIHELEKNKEIQITDFAVISYRTTAGIIPGVNSDVSGYVKYINRNKFEWDLKTHYYGRDNVRDTDDDLYVETRSSGPVKVKIKYSWELMPFTPVHP